MRGELLERLLAAREQRQAVLVLTRLDGAGQWLLDADGELLYGADGLSPETLTAAQQMLAANRSGRLDDPQLFAQAFNPPLRLYVVGAVHIAQALAPMARQTGYDVTVIDPRRAWASAERFPGVALDDRWPDDALEALGLDRRCALVTLSHDPKIDDPALTVGLRSAAFYIGALGSRKTHAGRCQRLQEAGFAAADLERIHAPIGLDLGGRSPAEIALAVMAQITQVQYRGGHRCDRGHDPARRPTAA